MGNKQQRQKIEDEGEGKGNKREREEVFVPEWDRGLPLDKEETEGIAHRKMIVCKGKSRNPV